MPIVFNENNPIAGKGAIEAVVNLIKDNSNDIADINEDIGGLDDGMENLDNRIGVLEETYNDTMNIANNQLNELIDGKAQIAQALTDRGYPTQPTDSSASMAQKIENMSYDAGWLAQLGYSETNDGGVKEAVAYSKSIKDGWNIETTSRTFAGDLKLKFFPAVDTSHLTSISFNGCKSLISILTLDLSECTNLGSAFKDCTGLTEIQGLYPLKRNNTTSYNATFSGCANLKKIKKIDLQVANGGSMFAGCTSLVFMEGHNLGIVPNYSYSGSYAPLPSLVNWGAESEENRLSLVHTLKDYSFDRATAGYSVCTVQLHADTLARLTAEEIAAITAKGFTLTS